MHERRQLVGAERLDELTVGIGEREGLIGELSEERLGAVLVGRDDPCNPAVGAGEPGKDAGGGVEQPGALVGVRIEHHGHQVEQLELLVEGSILPAQRVQHEVGR